MRLFSLFFSVIYMKNQIKIAKWIRLQWNFILFWYKLRKLLIELFLLKAWFLDLVGCFLFLLSDRKFNPICISLSLWCFSPILSITPKRKVIQSFNIHSVFFFLRTIAAVFYGNTSCITSGQRSWPLKIFTFYFFISYF